MPKQHCSDVKISLPCPICAEQVDLTLSLLDDYMIVNQLQDSQHILNLLSYDMNDTLYFYTKHICNNRQMELIFDYDENILYRRYRLDLSKQENYDLYLELMAEYRLGLFDSFVTYNFHSSFAKSNAPNLLAITIGQTLKTKTQEHYLFVCRMDVKIYSTHNLNEDLFYYTKNTRFGYYTIENGNFKFELKTDLMNEIFEKYILNPDIAEKFTFQIKKIISVYLLTNEENRGGFKKERFIIVLCEKHKTY